MTAKENRYIINGLMIWWNYICFHVRSDVSIRLVPIIPVTLPSLVLLTINAFIFVARRLSGGQKLSNLHKIFVDQLKGNV